MRRFDMSRYTELARQAAEEGVVLLRNENNTLPLLPGTKVTIFGRNQLNYYKSGTGSGGMVNTAYVISILDALLACKDIKVNNTVLQCYREWVTKHPFERGVGWASEPWCQEEMPLDDTFVEEASKNSDVALVLIGRTAGEDKDNSASPGSYYLSSDEENLLKQVCSHFVHVVVLLNTGNFLDMNWVEKYTPDSILLVWQGGQEGGRAVADLLTGVSTPSGKLTDTIARNISDYPSTKNFGDFYRNVYEEDIYIGYRYFETFAKEKVIYPFGFGLSYTEFDVRTEMLPGTTPSFKIIIKNTGNYSGKEVVQVYCEAPQGVLGKPARVLCGFVKSKLLCPGAEQTITISIPMSTFASYDDSGITGYCSCYVLEAGEYRFYVGSDVRSATYVGNIVLEQIVLIEQLRQAAAPVTPFNRLKPVNGTNGKWEESFEPVPLRKYALSDRVAMERPRNLFYTGDQGWRLKDVADGKVSMDCFIRQLTAEELCILVRGEGMCSPKVTPGTAAAFGGITPTLQAWGIPAGCCADGPSGLRMDCGTIAVSIPSGTCLGCTFNVELSEELFDMMGMELRKNRIDTLLGPGMNLHRNPLNGRNFEYFSEDPFLTGKMAAAQLRGMHRNGVTATIKHLACNNQEYGRRDMDVVVSERALREIYLKCFEIAVKEGDAFCVMSSYNAVNGLWTASNYDLLTSILRNEWSFDGMVMTDWHAVGNEEGHPASMSEVAPMIRSQNDLYMVVTDAVSNSGNDNLMDALGDGRLNYTELCRSAGNICKALMRLPAYRRMVGEKENIEFPIDDTLVMTTDNIVTLATDGDGFIDLSNLSTEQGASHALHVLVPQRGRYHFSFELRANAESDLAQLSMSITKNGEQPKSVSLMGYERDWKHFNIDLGSFFMEGVYLKLYFGQSGLQLRNCRIIMVEE